MNEKKQQQQQQQATKGPRRLTSAERGQLVISSAQACCLEENDPTYLSWKANSPITLLSGNPYLHWRALAAALQSWCNVAGGFYDVSANSFYFLVEFSRPVSLEASYADGFSVNDSLGHILGTPFVLGNIDQLHGYYLTERQMLFRVRDGVPFTGFVYELVASSRPELRDCFVPHEHPTKPRDDLSVEQEARLFLACVEQVGTVIHQRGFHLRGDPDTWPWRAAAGLMPSSSSSSPRSTAETVEAKLTSSFGRWIRRIF